MTSVTRISNLRDGDFDVAPIVRAQWADGDYVAARVTGRPSALYKIEIANGRMVDMMQGDLVIGALGKRAATLEGVGDWEVVGEDGQMHALTGAGLFGKATSTSLMLPPLMSLKYLGHVQRSGEKQTMQGFVRPVAQTDCTAPVVLMVGTSMSAGKTTAGRIVVHELCRAGLRVVGVKFTGAGRYRDTLSYGDAGAAEILDFVDAGLPSTVVPEAQFTDAMRYMLSLAAAAKPDVVLAEAGASPLEPYNGTIAINALSERLAFVVLCASDPYAVVGVQTAFGLTPDVVTGPATNTTAGIALIQKLTKLPALNLMDPDSIPALRELLNKALPDARFLPAEQEV
jgi:hypothetical protein